MSDLETIAEATPLLQKQTGIVIPVYLPTGESRALAAALLRDLVQACLNEIDDPANICLSVDGGESGAEVASQLAREFAVRLVVGQQNRGKLYALRSGAGALLERSGLRYVAVLDGDGDHFPNELLNFVRGAEYTRRRAGVTDILVLGRRLSRHRPMGFLRGELEELADRVLLDALAFRAAFDGRPLRLESATSFDEFPDFHSGYKLFSVDTARRVFLSEPQLSGVDETAYYKHACEAVMVVEALAQGSYLAVVNRSTMNEQPVTTFGLLDRSRLVADKIIWPCKRLGVPLTFVDQWLRNHMPRLMLVTLSPGKEELKQIRALVCEALGGVPDGDIWGPPFV